jgi:D-tyrosyl-tRNA(Tyr) deacylase
VLLGIGHGDTRAEADWLADKICGLRIFADPPDPDPEIARKRLGNMNRALRDAGGALLVISQFTLYADTSRGRRPSFTGAMPPTEAEALYEYFVGVLRGLGFAVATGRFGAMMAVELVNEGPVTIWLDSRETTKRPPEPAAEGSS